MSAYDAMVRRGRARYGDRFDESGLAPQFREWYGSENRVQISGEFWAGRPRTGKVSATTGWRPSFMLMYRSSDSGSADLLGRDDHVIAVQRRPGGPYVPVTGSGQERARPSRNRINRRRLGPQVKI